MSITSSVGLFSGIDSGSIINQLMQLEARPRTLIQRRVAQLQTQQAGYLDIKSRLSSLLTASTTFRTARVFNTMRAASSDDTTLTASASTTAQQGSFRFIVDRLVTTQQVLSRGFADRDVSALGVTSFTFESSAGRLDRDTSLAAFNGSSGVSRGKIVITQGGNSATVDLSRAATVSEVLEAIRSASGVNIEARVDDGRLVLSSSGGAFSVASAAGYTTAESLGIAGSSAVSGSGQALTGQRVYYAGQNTALSSLNDGNGVYVSDTIGETRWDFQLLVDDGGGQPKAVRVNIGSVYTASGEEIEGAATTLGKVVERINAAIASAGVADVSASIASDGTRLQLNNSAGATITLSENLGGSSASDLGFAVGVAISDATISGRRLLAGINDTLAYNLNGRTGASGQVHLTARDGTAFSVDISGAETVGQIMALINQHADNGGRIAASLNDAGTGLQIRDMTGATATALLITGSGAESLGISTGPDGVSSSVYRGASAQLAYITQATLLSSLNNGAGVGTGEIRVTDPMGRTARIDIGSDTKTVHQLLRELNGQFAGREMSVVAALNDRGDGIVIRERDGVPSGPGKIKVEDLSGQVASKLRLLGEAGGTGAENFIDGSFETTVQFLATDTLAEIAEKINNSKAGVIATIINDGGAGAPFRLSLVSRTSGRSGRVAIDTHGFDLGQTMLDAGEDARVFFGSSDPASAVLLRSSTNTLDAVINGVRIDLKKTSSEPIELSVTRDNSAIEAKIDEFINAFNAVTQRIDFQTRYDAATQQRGPLLGDGTLASLRTALFSAIQAPARGVSGPFQRLADVGLRFGDRGQLSINKERLRSAMEQDFQAVADLFAARDLLSQDEFEEIEPGIRVRRVSGGDEFSRLGLAGIVESVAKVYGDSIDGFLTARSNALDVQMRSLNRQIDDFNVRLERRRDTLQRQFLAMERSVAQLQSQNSALTGLMTRR
ncbi:MAG: flagellar filament capping protein FliD [Phycisphaeraceae bacterium]|nr:flagellar filament capping protein FliD [Phycisphaeraceae bacterium]MCW5755257.1 flagellar filament capping protein FliD [Phycisphaeraceae bacterium]